jgi:uncharacterized protein
MNDIPLIGTTPIPLPPGGRESKAGACADELTGPADSYLSLTADMNDTTSRARPALSPSAKESPAIETGESSRAADKAEIDKSPCHPPHPIEEVTPLGSLKEENKDATVNVFSAIDIETLGEIFSVGGKEHKAPEPELLPVPDTRQSTDYSCGASALQAVLMYYGEEYLETDLMKMLGTTHDGTNPRDIVRVARELDFKAELREHCTFEDIEKSLKEKVPVLISGQAWRDGEDLKKPWKDVWESGHYMVIIGLDDKNVYIEDPSLLGSKGFIPRDEFMERWHDVDEKKYEQMAIFIKGKKPSPPPPFIHID